MENIPIKKVQSKEVAKESTWLMRGADYATIRNKFQEVINELDLGSGNADSLESDLQSLASAFAA